LPEPVAGAAPLEANPPLPATVTEEPQHEVGCRHCGTANPPDCRYCIQCGLPLAAESTPEPTATPEPRTATPDSRLSIAAVVAPAAPGKVSHFKRYAVRAVGVAAILALVAGGVVTYNSLRSKSASGNEATSQEAVATASDIGEILAQGVDLTSFDVEPNRGIDIPTDDGRRLVFSDSYFSIEKTSEDGTTTIGRVGTMAGWFQPRDDVLVFQLDAAASTATAEWADWVLGATPGVERVGSEWIIRDVDAFAAELPSLEPRGGNWIYDADRGAPGLLDALEFRFIYYWPEDDHFWAVDDVTDQVWLLAEDGSQQMVIAGMLVARDTGVEFEEQPGLDATTEAEVARARERLVAAGLSAASDRTVNAVPALLRPGGQEAMAARYGICFGACGWVKAHIINPVADRVGNYVPVVVEGVATGIGGVYEVGAGIFTGDVVRVRDGLWQTAEGFWIATEPLGHTAIDIVTLALVKDCGFPGPGSGSDGSGRPSPYLDDYYGSLVPSLANMGETGSEWIQRGLLAQAWMPGVKLSLGERCGRIIRITAAVAPTDAQGNPVARLAEAARVQITYTVFYAEDGGVATVTGAHPGDNEGFSVGLVRSNRTEGRCGLTEPHFQLVGGKSAAHETALWGALRPTSDSIGVEWNRGSPCPAPPASWGLGLRAANAMAPETSDNSYRIWSSLNKHGTYFRESTCDVGLWGAEECVDGRPVYDLHHWVELVITDVNNPLQPTVACDADTPASPVAWPPASDLFAHAGRDKAFYCMARRGSDDPHGDEKYDVPGLDDADYAGFTPPVVPDENEVDTEVPTEIATHTRCSGSGQVTSFEITGLFPNSAVTVLVLDQSTALATVVADLSATSDAIGRYNGSFDWGANGVYLDTVRIEVSQATAAGTRSVEIDVPTTAGCWPPPTSEYTLRVSLDGSGVGSVSSSPSGIDCGGDCSQRYGKGTTVVLTASPASGSVFSGWSGACSGMGSCVVTMNGDQSVIAMFDYEESTNHPPDAVDLEWTLSSEDLGQEITLNVITYATDPDGDVVRLADVRCYGSGCEMIETGPVYESSCCVRFSVRSDGVGSVEIPIEYEVTDGNGGYDTATLYVIVNYPDGSSSVAEDATRTSCDAEIVVADLGLPGTCPGCLPATCDSTLRHSSLNQVSRTAIRGSTSPGACRVKTEETSA
jgi:hypothetical protein